MTAARGIALAALLLAACTDSAAQERQAQGTLAYQQGYQALEAHDYATAAERLGAAATLLPDDPYTALDLGVACQNLGRLDEARAAYRRAIALGGHAMPRGVTDPRYAGRTVAQLAQADLDAMAK